MAEANIETKKDSTLDSYILTFQIIVSNDDMRQLDLSLLRDRKYFKIHEGKYKS